MLDYSELRGIQKQERESAALVKLENDFYDRLFGFLKEKRQEAVSSGSLVSMREYENLRRIAASIQSKREEKIVLMALRGAESGAGLTSEETSLLRKISEVLRKSREKISKNLEEQKKEKVIKILSDVERYKGADSRLYGPFSKGDEISLPEKEIEWLLKSKLAEIVKS